MTESQMNLVAEDGTGPPDHRTPNNCPTFYDGCHCIEHIDVLVRSVAQLRAEVEHRRCGDVVFDTYPDHDISFCVLCQGAD